VEWKRNRSYPGARPNRSWRGSVLPLTWGCTFQLRHRVQSFLEPVDDGLLGVETDDSLLNHPVAGDYKVGGEGVHIKRVQDLVILVAVLGPIHFFLGDEVAPGLFVGIRADTDQYQFVAGIFAGEVLQFRNRLSTRWTPGRPEIEHHDFTGNLVERQVLSLHGGQPEIGRKFLTAAARISQHEVCLAGRIRIRFKSQASLQFGLCFLVFGLHQERFREVQVIGR
jgi:hypothetical protein